MMNNNMLGMLQQLRSNPMEMLSKKYKFPQGMNMNDPNEIIQHLLNTGQVTQSQVNQAMSMRNNPIIQQMMRR